VRWTRVSNYLLLTVGIADTLEILLLLLWRHLQYYTEARPAESQIQVSTPHITRLVTSMDVESFRAEVPRRLGALLQRLDTLDMVIIIDITLHTRSDVYLLRQNNESLAENGDWRFNRAYIETICRRIRETTGLQEPENDGQGQF
jgi:nuclear pore complex protein Nup205